MIKKMYLFLVVCFLAFVVLACSDDKKDDEQNEVKEYTVTFVVDGNETKEKVAEGEKVTKPADPVKDGYEFIGWYLGEEEYTFNKVTSNITVVAKFNKVIKEYTVTFIVGEEKTTLTVKEGESVTKPAAPVKDGYNFIGWYQADTLYVFGDVYEDITLTAKFEKVVVEVKEYTVTFVVGDEETKVKVTEGEKVSKPVSPVKDGYNFIGWYQDGALYEFNTLINEDITLTAKFEVNVIMPEKIVISGSEIAVAGFEEQYTATVYPEGASQEVEWISLGGDEIELDPVTGYVKFWKGGMGKIRAVSKVDPSVKSQIIYIKINGLHWHVPDFMGYEIVIMAPETMHTDIDPFLDEYTKPDKVYKQKTWRQTERIFNCKIVVKPYPKVDLIGKDYINYIIDGANNNTSEADISIVFSHDLYKLAEGNGNAIINTTEYVYKNTFLRLPFRDENIIYNIVKEASTYKDKVYTVGIGTSKTDTFVENGLYYNVGWLEKLGVEDPAKMFNDGKWNYTNFKNWCLEVQALLGDNQYAIGGHPYYYWLGLTNAAGVKVVDNVNNTINIDSDRSKDAAKLIQELASLKAVDTNETWAENDGGFIQGTTLMTTGKMWFANNSSRWKSDMFGEDTRIGYVPFPYPDDLSKEDTMISITSMPIVVFNKGKENQYPFGLGNEHIQFALAYLNNETILMQELQETFNSDEIIENNLSKYINNEESIEAVKYFDDSKVFYDAIENINMTEYYNSISNIFFNGADYNSEIKNIKDGFESKFNEIFVN